jgi:hypothetical protein
MSRTRLPGVFASSASALGALALLTGCPEIEVISAVGDAGGEPGYREDVGNRKTPQSRSPNKLDLLFVIDTSESMAGEQAALRAQLPRLVERLASGERFAGDPEPYAPISDMHIGVVSSDMGIAGVDSVQRCDAGGGDDGRLQRRAECGGEYPRFLSYLGDSTNTVGKVADDLSCMTSLGTDGCAIEQPLDAALKALTTRDLVDADGNATGPNRFTFISTTQEGTRGRGDRENSDFVRTERSDGDSLLAIVVVTDDDDCSLRDTSFFSSGVDLEHRSD